MFRRGGMCYRSTASVIHSAPSVMILNVNVFGTGVRRHLILIWRDRHDVADARRRNDVPLILQ